MLKTRSGRCIKQNSDYNQKLLKKNQQKNLINKIKKILDKSEQERSIDDLDLLNNFQDLVKQIDSSKQNRINALAHQQIILDDQNTLEIKCAELAKLLNESKCCVIYTGAGISTSASIPDYRGPNGLWTMLEKGIKIKLPDFSMVEPTYAHMALKELVNIGLVKHIVSQNCDGLHLRSGLNREKLSELHGNCFIEFCIECNTEYLRLFDVTEKTAFRKHLTGRYCKKCLKNNELRDSIIHFGEKLRNGMPYNWENAREQVKNADLIICLGTSLKVLKHYACLWPKKKNINLSIVNIQWTPKDKLSKIKINGYSDHVIKLLVNYLNRDYSYEINVNNYLIENDPLLKLAIKLEQNELNTTTKCALNIKKDFKNENINEINKVDDDHDNNSNQNSNDLKNVYDKQDDINLIQQEQKSPNSWYTKSFKQKKANSKSIKNELNK